MITAGPIKTSSGNSQCDGDPLAPPDSFYFFLFFFCFFLLAPFDYFATPRPPVRSKVKFLPVSHFLSVWLQLLSGSDREGLWDGRQSRFCSSFTLLW